MVSQKYHKDRNLKPLRSFSNTICVLSESSKDIFVVSKDSVVRGRFCKWREFVELLFKEKKWVEALKLMVELSRG